MSDRWWEYFESNMAGKHWLQEAVSQFQFMQPLYGRIQRYLPSGGKILDVGCGMGFNDIYLSSLGYEVTGLDNDQRIVDAASKNAEMLGSRVTFRAGDAFDLSNEYDSFDMAYSLGVLEHFDRDVTIELLKEQARCAKFVLIEIPSRYTALTGSITDERIYTMRQLRNIVTDAGLTIEESFGFGDVTVTKSQILLKRLLPYGAYRALQNSGFAFGLAVIASVK